MLFVSFAPSARIYLGDRRRILRLGERNGAGEREGEKGKSEEGRGRVGGKKGMREKEGNKVTNGISYRSRKWNSLLYG